MILWYRLLMTSAPGCPYVTNVLLRPFHGGSRRVRSPHHQQLVRRCFPRIPPRELVRQGDLLQQAIVRVRHAAGSARNRKYERRSWTIIRRCP